ncbi:MAG: hypothetical protein HOB82_03650 [Alphaproteobacteria bacterium]|nr:hypothetical protein [Alphaproteobacteria bacterium]MBT4710605.1 hypothetical protein [Alphaproteobacteria bacterium]
MTAAEVVERLRQRGSAKLVGIYQRRGAADEALGISYKDIDALAKTLGTDHDLALALWTTEIHEARLLAARIADPNAMTDPQINHWVSEAQDYLVSDAVSEFAAQMPNAGDLAESWIPSLQELTAASGWNVIAHLAMAKTLDAGDAEKLIAEIQGQIHHAPNRTRHSMNGALIAIGGTMPDLADAALAAAKAIGKVTVDHGKTGCKTPDAAPYMARMIARAAAKA